MGRFTNHKITTYLLIIFSLVLFGINFAGIIPITGTFSEEPTPWWGWVLFAVGNCFYIGMMIIVILTPVT
jgi:hypothetical protein